MVEADSGASVGAEKQGLG